MISKVSKLKRKDNRTSQAAFAWMVTPFMFFFFLFTILPILISIFFSFTDFNMVTIGNFVGFDNYIRMMVSDKIFITAVRNTMILAIITGPIGFMLSFVLAWLINELPAKLRPWVTFFIYAPSLSGNAFFIWTYIFAADSYGLANSVLTNLGIISGPISWLTDVKYNLTIVIIVSVWMSFSGGFLSFRAGLQGLDRAYFEAAAIDGLRNRWQELYFVTFPQMGPQLLYGAVTSISSAFATGAISAALTGNPSTNYSTHTWLLHINDYATTRFEMGYASALSVVLFIVMVLSWLLIKKVLSKFTD